MIELIVISVGLWVVGVAWGWYRKEDDIDLRTNEEVFSESKESLEAN